MGYSIDERDLMFCLFEHQDAAALAALPHFRDQDEELYRMVIREAIKYATEEIAPTHAPAEEEGCRLRDGQVRMPKIFHKLYKNYCEAGWNAMTLPPAWGGQGLPGTLSAGAQEAIIGANCSFSFTPGLSATVVHLLDAHGSEEIKALYLKKLTAGQWAGTMCLTEPNVGTALADTSTTATPLGDGVYSMVGTKMFITSGDQDLTENIIHIVLARVADAPKGIKGLGLFLVPKIRVNADGSLGKSNDVHCTKIEEKMGLHASPTCLLNYGDAGECRAWIIGGEGDGIHLMFNMMNEARIGVGLQGLALMSAVYRMALDYAKERIQGVAVLSMKDPNAPRVPIIEHPDVRRMLMELKANSEGCRALVYYSARLYDMARYSEDEKTREKCGALLELMTPITKAYPSDRAFEAASTAIQVMGGVGYCREYGVEQYLRDAKVGAIYEGTNGIQALDLVGRKLAMKGGAVFMTYMVDLASFIEKGGHSDLADCFGDLGGARDKIAGMAMRFMESARRDPIYPILSATPFLEAMGHLSVARLLLEQAVIATDKLELMARDKEMSDWAALAETGDEAAFYYNKVLTARFFIKNILPRVDAISTRVLSGDKSCLDALL